ncbi:hypothetical protein HDU76_002310 [Blyttiomyces sp. JEL0837]|nr:hypothetical protein HDU76_002310 [Blyttiomyces sp. JEL0837]
MSASSSSVVVTKQPGMAPMQSSSGLATQQKSYAHEMELPANPGSGAYAACLNSCGVCLGTIGMLPCCCCCNPFRTVQQGTIGLITRFGRYYKSVDPGLWKINILTESMHFVDIKIQISDIPQVMTKDNVQVAIDSVLFWEIVDPYVSKFLVTDVRKALIERTQTTLRHIFGTRTLQDSIENRETIAHEIQDIIAEPAKAWGVQIESVLIKDLQFSKDLQETLSAAAKQKRIGESKVILAHAEVESAKLMREASDILNTPAAMQIRYLETLSQMSKAAGTKVIFMPTTSNGAPDMKAVTSSTVMENVTDMI